MLINLVPDFLAVLGAPDPVAAYQAYFRAHERILGAYWSNYVIEPDAPQFLDVVRATVTAQRDDLHALLRSNDLIAIARAAEAQCRDLLAMDTEVDIVLMVGVGGANAGELVVGGRGIAFVCLEHFTGVANPGTHGLGLEPELIPMWLAHEVAHAIRYTSPASDSAMRHLVDAANGTYSYWETGQRAPLRELLVNEGLAVQASRLISPGHAEWEYFGYTRREYARVRELAPLTARSVTADLDRAGLGLRLRYLSGGMSASARTFDRAVLPERSGYYLGARMVEAAIRARGLPWALRASAESITEAAHAAQIA